MTVYHSCKVYSFRLHAQDPVILLGSYICYTTNRPDTIEAPTAETHIQLVATESMCHSTSLSAVPESGLANVPTLYCAVPYVVSCVDVSGTVLS